MPGKTGLEVLEVIKANDALRRIPVAVLTASDQEDDVAQSYGLGSNHFMRKPEDPAELEHELRLLLEYAERLSGRSGAGNLEATAVSAVNPRSVALRKFLINAAYAAVIVALLVFAYFRGV